jgi:two-component system sensor histidine kinase QseC
VFVAAIQGYRTSMNKASGLFDSQLQSLATSLISITDNQSKTTIAETPDFAFQLWQDNELLIQTSNVPTSAISPFRGGFNNSNFNNQRWRVFTRKIADKRWLMVAQPIAQRIELAEDVILSAVTPIIISIPLLAILVSLCLRQGLKPLTKLAKTLTHKKADDLSIIDTSGEPLELIPVIETLNDVFERLDEAFKREKRFASDAAHELRTPLSILKVTLHNSILELGSDNNSLNDLSQGVERMSHVVDQILMLNRTNPAQLSVKFTLLDLHQIAQNVIANYYPKIEQRQQSISLDGMSSMVMGEALSLEILLQNLISNASKYTPDHGEILVTSHSNNNHAQLIIEDSGPGIEPSQYHRIFDRFYRIGGDQHNSKATGCGLGLSIVQHIAQLHCAEILLDKSSLLGGFKITVKFDTLTKNSIADHATPESAL